MTKHTSGPWKQHLVDEMTVIDAAGNHICDTSPPGYGYDDDIAFNTDSERCEANARLIAAAPDMYEALKWFIENDDTNEGDEPLGHFGGLTWNQVNSYWLDGLNRARAAIAKAEGFK